MRHRTTASHAPDAVIVGAGVVGAACAYYASRAGLAVTVVDRGPVAGGTTGAGEGNLLVSDKEAGPELDLALLSTRLWRELAEALPPEDAIEYELKGGLVVTSDETALTALRTFAKGQRDAGVEAYEIPAGEVHALEPHLAPGLAGAFHYPQDAQVQPARAAAALLRAAGTWAPSYGSARRSPPSSPTPTAPYGASAPRAATCTPRSSSTPPEPGADESPRSPAPTCP
ncbi:hypothetical protein GCM10023237_13490 [Streptomyces coeruleoprunus]